jgi:PAS domain S-box-containing protein
MKQQGDIKPGARVESAKRRSRSNNGAHGLPSGDDPAYEELLHFFNESPDLLCIAGFDGIFKRLNPAWQPALGWTLEELRARPFLDFVLPEDRPGTMAEMQKLAIGIDTITFENRYHCKDGTCKWLQWTARPLPGLQEVYAIARDVTRQRRLEQEILETMDRERERVGRELHDGVCQDLAAICAFSGSLARKLARAAAPESVEAREIGRLLQQSIRQARDLARGFNPVHLEAIGLMAALEDFCVNTAALFKIACTFRGEPYPPKLDVNREAHLYRIVQEAVNNAIAHGRGRRIEVHLAFEESEGSLAIMDDGVGIGSQLGDHSGIGLHTMAYRARLIGAWLEVNRRSPRGTVVTCVFPLQQSKPNPAPKIRRAKSSKVVGQKTHPRRR